MRAGARLAALAVLAWAFATASRADAGCGANPVSIAEYGALADGHTDSTAAIRAAIMAARARAGFVLVPPGRFAHRGFVLDGVGLCGAGPGSALLAPDPDDGDIVLRGEGSSLRNIALAVASTRRDDRTAVIHVDHARGFTIENVTITRGNAGVLNVGGSFGRILDNRISDTLADAIHNTDGAHDIIVAGNVVRRAGDDMVAVVSYQGQPLVHDVLIENNDLADQSWGRGIAVVGGRDVVIRNNHVARTLCCAGIYLADESAWHTRDVAHVLVQENRLEANGGWTFHGAIMLFADQGAVRDIRIERNAVAGARHAAVTFRGRVGDVVLRGNAFIDPVDGGISGQAEGLVCQGNTLDGVALGAATCASAGASTATAPVRRESSPR